MERAYTFVFQPEPEGGFTVTCPALPGLVTYGETMSEAREMALDAMEGLIELMLEKEGRVPESDAEEAIPRPPKGTRAAIIQQASRDEFLKLI
jgi:predicted RNase H-like HicB family nuclease